MPGTKMRQKAAVNGIKPARIAIEALNAPLNSTARSFRSTSLTKGSALHKMRVSSEGSRQRRVSVRKRRACLVVVALLVVWSGSGFSQPSQPPGGSESRKNDKGTDKSEQMAAHTAVGRVKSAALDRLVVAGKSKGQDAEWTFVLDAGTKIRRGGQDITAAD